MSYYNGEELIELENKVTALEDELQAKTDLLALVIVEKTGLVEENAELREAIESAMRIKDLWLPFHVVANEHEGEAVPLHKMYNRFYQLLNK